MVGRIVDPVRVREQSTRERAQLEELVPLPSAADQARHLQAQYESYMVQADLGDQPLEAGPVHHAGGGAAQILVDHQDPGRGPAQTGGPLDEPVLQAGRLCVINDLLGRRLSDIHDRETVPMPRLDLALNPFPRCGNCQAHRGHPRPTGPWEPPCARPAPPADGPPSAGSDPERLPTAESGGLRSGAFAHPDSPPSSASASRTRSLRTTAAAASRPSNPTTGAFPTPDSPMYAVRLAP